MRVAAAAVLALVVVLTVGTHRRRVLQQNLADQVLSIDRFVDAHVRLHVVEVDPNGAELIPGNRPLRILRTHNLGGWIDTKSSPPRLMTECELGTGRDWYCSVDQEPLILHGDSEPAGKLVLGGMGAGKTTAGAMWLYARWLEHIGTHEEFGVTAPTNNRLQLVLDEIFKPHMFAANWYRYSTATRILTMCDGTRMRCVSTHKQSASQGSRIQGFNWSAWLGDELQDQLEEFLAIQARLRAAKTGRAKRLATATAKDDPQWRTAKDQMLSSGIWTQHQMLGPNSPFIHPDHWDKTMKAQMTESQYRRFVLAEDLPSESRLYSTFTRKDNVRPIPIGARKITSIVLSKKTGSRQDAIAVGHDPGAAKAGTVWADAYEIPTRKGEVLWWVRGELFTLHETHEQHAAKAMRITRDRFGCNMRPDGERAHVRCQPLGVSEDKPDLDVFAIWKRIGFQIHAAQYSKQGTGFGHIKKESRIGVVNTLFRNAHGQSRLFLECDDRGLCVAPLLLSALETMERDDKGRAEHEEKNVKHDKSDLPAALGYLLWPFEKELATALRLEIRRGIA